MMSCKKKTLHLQTPPQSVKTYYYIIIILQETYLHQLNGFGEIHFSIQFFQFSSVFSPLDVTKSYTLDLEAGVNWEALGINPCQAALVHITYSNCFNGLFIQPGTQLINWNIRQKVMAHALGLYLRWSQSQTTMDQSSCRTKIESLSKGVVGKCNL